MLLSSHKKPTKFLPLTCDQILWKGLYFSYWVGAEFFTGHVVSFLSTFKKE